MKDLQETLALTAHHREGYRIEVAEDPDGLGCVEISYIEDQGNFTKSITLSPAEAKFVAKAIPKVLAFFRERDLDKVGLP